MEKFPKILTKKIEKIKNVYNWKIVFVNIYEEQRNGRTET